MSDQVFVQPAHTSSLPRLFEIRAWSAFPIHAVKQHAPLAVVLAMLAVAATVVVYALWQATSGM